MLSHILLLLREVMLQDQPSTLCSSNQNCFITQTYTTSNFSGTLPMLFPWSLEPPVSLPAWHILIPGGSFILPGKSRYSFLCIPCVYFITYHIVFKYSLCVISILYTVNILKSGNVSFHPQCLRQSRHSKIFVEYVVHKKNLFSHMFFFCCNNTHQTPWIFLRETSWSFFLALPP